MFEVFNTQYELYLSLIMVAGIMACRYVVAPVLTLFGGFKDISQLNKAVVDEMKKKPFWVANQKKESPLGRCIFCHNISYCYPFCHND